MKSALLLINVRCGALERARLMPKADVLVQRMALLLHECRALRIPVFHVHCLWDDDGRQHALSSHEVTGPIQPATTPESPSPLRPIEGEFVSVAATLNPFLAPSLSKPLDQQGIKRLILAGLSLHDCVGTTALEALDRGFVEVWLADECIGTNEPDHAELMRILLERRGSEFVSASTIVARLAGLTARSAASVETDIPVGHIAGRWSHVRGRRIVERRNPSRWSEVLARVPMAEREDVAAASRAAAETQRSWMRHSAAERTALMDSWAQVLSERASELASLLAVEVGKPITDSRDEVARAVALARTAAELFRDESAQRISTAAPVHVCFRPHGVVGLITPWNNPVAIAVGKIAPALAAGNGVVWKPAIEAPRTAVQLLESLIQAGAPTGLVNLVFGDADTARQVIDNANISAVSLTGSVETGRAAAARCLRHGKPLQAELGGNNAAVVLRDCNVKPQARALALASFSFAGQRCTRIQRFIVEQEIVDEFQTELVAAVQGLHVGDPRAENTHVGPLISRAHRDSMLALLQTALSHGAQLLCGGKVPESLEDGCWLTPAVVTRLAAGASLVKDEIFGPLAVIVPAENFEHAISLANDVEYGLLAAVYTDDELRQRQFSEMVQAGMVKLAPGPLDVHPLAPFGGWKASRLGPPEHGVWDRDFYLRVQAVYGELRGLETC